MTELSRVQVNLLAVNARDSHGPALAHQLDASVAGVHGPPPRVDSAA